MKKKKGFPLWGLMTVLAVLLGIFLKDSRCFSSSGTISLYTGEGSYFVGDEVNLVVDVNSTAGISFVDMEFLYDESLLEYVSGDKGVTGSEGLVQISDHFSKNKNRKKYNIKFKALKEGSWEFLSTTDPLVYDASFETMSLSILRTTVVIERDETVKKEASLSFLRVAEGEISPKFSAENKEYEVVVSNEVTVLTIYADSTDDTHIVTIEGNEDLRVGNNRVMINVEDNTGNKVSYILMVYRNSVKEDEELLKSEEEKETEKPVESEKPKEEEKSGEDALNIETGEGLKAQKINGKLNLLFSQRFILIPLPEGVVIPSGYEKTQLIIDGNSLTAYTLESDLENDFLLFYGKLETGKEGFYFYDRVDKTLQRYSGNPYLHTDRNMTVIDENTYGKKVFRMKIAVGVLSGLLVAALIGLITVILKDRT